MLLARRSTLHSPRLLTRLLSKQPKRGTEEVENDTGTNNTKDGNAPRKPIKASELLKPFSISRMRVAKPTMLSEAPVKQPPKSIHDQNTPCAQTKICLPVSEQKKSSSQGSVIKSKVLLKHIAEQMTHRYQEHKKGSFFYRFTERLPEPENLSLVDLERIKSSMDQISKEKHPPTNAVFDTVENLELSLLISSSPMNQFEEWMQWTMEGKLWKFPIDNEQDWEAEQNVPFHEHMFLDPFIDKELRKSSPVSAFLDLVCSGLAQNPHFTVEQKREHLRWYAAYFRDKLSSIDASVREELRLAELEKEARGSAHQTQ